MMPALELGWNVLTPSFGLLFLQRFSFLIAITLPFDVRDVQQDRQSGIQTWAVIYGQQKVVRISMVLIGVFLLISWILVKKFNYSMYRVDLLLAAFVVFLLLSNRQNKYSETYYFLLDGSLLLMAIGYYFSF